MIGRLRSRGFRGALGALGVVALFAGRGASAQDFDPRGRHRPVAPRATGSSPPSVPAVAPAAGAPREALMQRYLRVVLAQPGDPFPLQRLAQLYRDRDGNVQALVKELSPRAGAGQPAAEAYAAEIALGGLAKLDGREDEAIARLTHASTLRPSDPAAQLALARVLQDRGDPGAARTHYEAALATQSSATDRAQTLRTLLGLALDGKDWAGASAYHEKLVKLEPTSLFVRGELGRELITRGEFARAVPELEALVKASAGDNRTLAPALRDLGRAQAKAGHPADGVATLKRALAAAGAEAAVRGEIYEAVADAYRGEQRLPVLIKELEAEHPTDYARLALLGALYEETGDAASALATYKRALAVNPRQIDLRLKVVHLLEAQGELDQAIAEYEALVRASPQNPQLVFDEADALIRRGDRARALKLLTDLEGRAGGSDDTLGRLADLYGRLGEGGRQLKILTRLAQVRSDDPAHLVDLGDRYFQDGNTPLAVQTWKRILTTVTPRGRALAALGDVYLEHDMTTEALAAFREALAGEPDSLTLKKQLASALERARNYAEARGIWEELSRRASGAAATARTPPDPLLAREVRTHLVTLWGLERTLEAAAGPLAAAFQATPPDVEAGRTLADVQLHLRRLEGAEATLRRVLTLAPGDADSYLALERVLVQEAKLEAAIATLDALAQVDPKRARELYQRMAQYALQLYRDDDAIRYAARAMELNPDDAEGHRRLAEMYRSRQDPARAIIEFRAAIAKNDRLFPVYFELADLLLTSGGTDAAANVAEADRLFRRVLRGAPDDELVARAGRLAMQVNLGKGTLGSLEQDLLPLAIGAPQRPVYRRLLVELYGTLTFGLVAEARGNSSDASEGATKARAELARIGARAVKPLLDALVDTDGGQQRTAIDVLGYVQNKSAGPPLFAFAVGHGEAPGDASLRARAMVACGALRDPALLPKYQAYLRPAATRGEAEADAVLDSTRVPPTDRVAVAATWGVARLADTRAAPLLRALLEAGSAEQRALAALGLGALHDAPALRDLGRMVRGLDAGVLPRAAAAYALGLFGPRAEGERPALLVLAQGDEPLARAMALLSLARLGAPPRAAASEGPAPASDPAIAAMSEALFAGYDPDSTRARRNAERLRRAGAAALSLRAATASATPSAARTESFLPPPELGLAGESILEPLVPPGLDPEARRRAFEAFAGPIEEAARLSLRTSGEQTRAVLDQLRAGARMAGNDGADGKSTDGAPRAADATGADLDPALAHRLLASLEPNLLPLAHHPDPAMRRDALSLLALSSSRGAEEAVIAALGDADESVARLALDHVGRTGDGLAALPAVSRVLSKSDRWALRGLAAASLGRLGRAHGGASEASAALREAALHDPFALVREEALAALASFDVAGASQVARDLAAHDAEPRVRESAAHLLAGDAPKASSPR